MKDRPRRGTATAVSPMNRPSYQAVRPTTAATARKPETPISTVMRV